MVNLRFSPWQEGISPDDQWNWGKYWGKNSPACVVLAGVCFGLMRSRTNVPWYWMEWPEWQWRVIQWMWTVRRVSRISQTGSVSFSPVCVGESVCSGLTESKELSGTYAAVPKLVWWTSEIARRAAIPGRDRGNDERLKGVNWTGCRLMAFGLLSLVFIFLDLQK